MNAPVLLPRPRTLRLTGDGSLALGRDGAPPSSAGPEVSVGGGAPRHDEGDLLRIDRRAVAIEARDAAGAHRARSTLAQILRAAAPERRVPALEIEDWPDFPVRGAMLDVSRDKVPTMATLRGIVDLLAELKYNQLQLYLEHTFAYARHPRVWADASPFTPDEIEDLDAYCRERFIELVPNQNSFGHMERWLVHPEYAALAEVPWNPSAHPPGERPGYMSLCPVDPRSLELVSGLYDELLPHFASRQLNVGLDETIDLGKGRSREACEARGAARVYLDFLLAVHRDVTRRGRTMQFWGDIVLEHPELIPELPKDLIALNWGYEADHPFDEEGRKFAEAGLRHVVCPGTSSWLSIGGRASNAIANIRRAARSARTHDALGLLVTDWGDHGHWQPLPVSYLGWAHGAQEAWSGSVHDVADLTEALDLHVYRDAAGVAAGAARGLGDAYLETGVIVKNATVLALLLLFLNRSIGEGRLKGLSVDGLERAEAAIGRAASSRERTAMARPDARLVVDELGLAADLMTCACRYGKARLEGRAPDVGDLPDLVAEFRRIWLERNRPGGLDDSVRPLEVLAVPR